MDSLKPYVIGLLCGFAFGVVLMERWGRTGQPGGQAAEDGGGAVDPETASTASADQPKVSAVIVAGAKADAQRARQLLERVMPWGSASGPSIAQLQRAGQANTRRSD
jgi:hypothetical protein